MKDNLEKINGKWEFNEEVTRVFDDMLERSIPDYEHMRSLTYRIGRNFIGGGGRIVDIGASNGLSSLQFVNSHPNCSFVLEDISDPMLEACAKRYEKSPNVKVVKNDLREGIGDYNDIDLVLSVLTIQFTPIEYRQDILADIYRKLRVGGALILVEKVIGNGSTLDTIFTREYYSLKRDHDYSENAIREKRKSLEGVLVPLTTSFNEHLLRGAGFHSIDCFWRNLNFSGWIAIK